MNVSPYGVPARDTGISRGDQYLGNGFEVVEQPQGTGAQQSVQDRDELLDIERVVKRFREQARHLKPNTQDTYVQRFRKFATHAKLGRLLKKQVAGKLGRTMILNYLQTVPRPSWRFDLAMLKLVWEIGLELAWPINTKRDIGRLPKVKPGETPSDAVVVKWADAIQRETDSYLRLLFLLVAQTGWRPSHIVAIDVADVRVANGKPVVIVRYPRNREFKSESPVGAHLPADLSEAIAELTAKTNSTILLPWRSSETGIIGPHKRLDYDTLARLWKSIERKWNLPHLTPKGLRHFVAGACRRSGLSKQASSWLMGHDPTNSEGMRDWYDSPRIEDILDEQATTLPNGPLGILRVPSIRVDNDLPKEVVSLVQSYLRGEMLTRELADELEGVRLHLKTNLSQ